MSRKYGIGFLVSMILLVLILICAYQYSYDRAVRKREMEQQAREKVLQTEGSATKEYGYIITEQDGYVIVYYGDRETVYEYTSLKVEYFSLDMQQQLKEGIVVTDVKEVYGFLENYSS